MPLTMTILAFAAATLLLGYCDNLPGPPALQSHSPPACASRSECHSDVLALLLLAADVSRVFAVCQAQDMLLLHFNLTRPYES